MVCAFVYGFVQLKCERFLNFTNCRKCYTSHDYWHFSSLSKFEVDGCEKQQGIRRPFGKWVNILSSLPISIYWATGHLVLQESLQRFCTEIGFYIL